MRFGRLEVIGQAEDYIRPNGKREAQWLCKCNCGNEVVVLGTSLKRGLTKSCGCFMKEMAYKANKKENKYNLSKEYGVGYTSNTNKEFYFDLEDYEKIKEYCWSENSDGYIKNFINNIYLHRLIMNVNNGYEVDHIRGENTRNDNRKSNLRIVTKSQNSMNKGLQSNNKSGVTGVYFDKTFNKWCSQITFNKKHINLGYFKNFKDAVRARNEAEQKYFGEYSYTHSQQSNMTIK